MTSLPCFGLFKPAVDKLQREVSMQVAADIGVRPDDLPTYHFSLLCYLPFWTGTSKCLSAEVCRINMLALHASWLLETVLDEKKKNGTMAINLAPALPLLGARIVTAGSSLPNGCMAFERLQWNVRSLIREKLAGLNEVVFVPYRLIWKKIAFGMFTADVCIPEEKTRSKFLNFFAFFEMLDEYVDLFEDVRNGDHNDLAVRMGCGAGWLPDQDFWSRYARHGHRLALLFERLAAYFGRAGLLHLAKYCASRSEILRERAQAVTAFTNLSS